MTDFTHQIFTATEIQAQVKRLAHEITADQRERQIEIVGLMNGAMVFTADLIRHMNFHLVVHTAQVQSYTKTQQGEAKIQISFDPKGKRLLLVDDILETGQSFLSLSKELNRLGAQEILTCVLLDKGKSKFKTDYTGFHCPDLWVVGYGMDYQGLYRNLPFIAELPPSLQ